MRAIFKHCHKYNMCGFLPMLMSDVTDIIASHMYPVLKKTSCKLLDFIDKQKKYIV